MLIELQYLPCIDFFIELLKQDGKLQIEACEHFQKQSYRNRTYILGANKTECLTIPIKHEANKSISEIEIDYSQRWTSVHLRAIQSAYGKSPFFEHYFPLLESIFSKKHSLLMELNKDLLTLCLKLLKINASIEYTQVYDKESNDKVYDLRNQIHPKKTPLNIDIISSLAYNQTLGKEFVKNLSIVDLLFNEGINAKSVLEKGILNSRK